MTLDTRQIGTTDRQKPTQSRLSFGQRFLALAEKLEDGAILRVAFFGMLIGTIGMLYIDYTELPDYTDQVVEQPQFEPVLPAVDRPEIDPDNPAYRPHENITTDQSVLSKPLEISLLPDGVLRLEGLITPGSGAEFSARIAEVGEYVLQVSLNSPGGSVSDALAIGRAIRLAKLPTAIASGEFCASSCPLIFAGGTKRLANAAAAVGVHQVYASQNNRVDAVQALSDAQTTTAEITRYLTEMDVDPALWVHALETPPDKLYYFTSKELKDFKIATKIEK